MKDIVSHLPAVAQDLADIIRKANADVPPPPASRQGRPPHLVEAKSGWDSAGVTLGALMQYAHGADDIDSEIDHELVDKI